MKNEIFAKIDSLYPEYVKVWEDVCNIESPTNFKEGVDKVGTYFIEKAKARGWQVEVFEQPVAGNAICITMNPESDAAPVCLSGHMDTVHAVGSFGTPAVKMDAERIYGPGVVDCKGGLVVGLLAMHALDEVGFRARPVKFILQSDEEGGSSLSKKKTIKFICEKAKGAVAFLNLEGSKIGSTEICLMRKGILTFKFTVKGAAAHASQCATLGSNAILEAAHKIIELEKLKDEHGITCCCSVIEGGTVVNTVPESCTFYSNVRFATEEQAKWMRDFAEKLASESVVEGTKTSVEIVSDRVCMELTDRNIALLSKMNDIFASAGMSTFEAGARLGGSDAAYTTMAGIPTIDNIGAEGGKIHSSKEFGILESLREKSKRVALVTAFVEGSDKAVGENTKLNHSYIPD